MVTGEQSRYRLLLSSAYILILIGGVHLLILTLGGFQWEGTVSPRKPALFGLSTGFTIWSIWWVMNRLLPQQLDKYVAILFGISLFAEVVLITIQFWRGEPSHFNNTSFLNSSIELTMLILILSASLGVFYLTLRTFVSLIPLDPAFALSIRAGMIFLSLSCFIGLLATVLGHQNLVTGRAPEILGKAGIMKFPHGAALHAIQILPALAWLSHRFRLQKPTLNVGLMISSQACFLIYATWQTCNGRSRFDFDYTGGFLLVISVLCSMIPVLGILLKASKLLFLKALRLWTLTR